jgi:predicted nucleotidyltransferase
VTPDPARISGLIAGALAGVPGIVSAYLFGSVASGRAHRESDVDVAVLLAWTAYPGREERFDARLRLIGIVGAALERNDVDLIVLNDVPPHLAREVVTRGHRVLVRDAEAEHAFRRDSMLRAADLEPFLRRARQVKLETLRR